MIDYYSPRLHELTFVYLDLVDRGNLTEERREAHNAMMYQMKDEGIAFHDREEARDIARGLVESDFAVEWVMLFWHRSLKGGL